MYFAKNLRFLRRRAELTQSDLGDQVGADYNTISRYESGKSTPKLDALTKLAQVFGVRVEDLRDVDLANLPAFARLEEPGPPYASPKADGKRPPAATLPTKPARHLLTVLIELDGTAACLERAVARLAAINEVVAATA